MFTGTPTQAGFDKPVSVTVDLSVAGADQTTLVFTATGVTTGAGTADQSVPDEKKAAVLRGVQWQPAGAEAAVRGAPTLPKVPADQTSSSKASPRE